MSPYLHQVPRLELGRLTARATFQDPDVRLVQSLQDPPALHLQEAGVLVILEFTDRERLEHFQNRLAHLRLGGER